MANTILQLIPGLDGGGAERALINIAKCVQQNKWKSIVASRGGRLVSELKDSQIEHIEFDHFKKYFYGNNKDVKRLREIIEENNVDLIHAHSRPSLWIALKAVNKKIPVLYRYHSPYKKIFLSRSMPKMRFEHNLRQADAITIHTQWLKKWIHKQHRLDDSKIVEISNAIDEDRFNAKNVAEKRKQNLMSKWEIQPNQFVILVPARLTAWKGHEYIIETAKEVVKEDSDVRFIFAGDHQGRTEYKNKLQNRINELNLKNQILIAGDCDDMPAAFAVCDISLNTTIKPETFGNVIMESLAMEKPVIASDNGAANETINAKPEYPDNQITGWIIKTKNQDELKNKIIEATKTKNLNEMGKRGRKFVTTKYGKKQLKEKITKLYEENIKK